MLGTATTDTDLATYDRDLALSKVGGNARIADELLELLLADLPGFSGTLRGAHGKRSYETLREVAHRIRGGACCCATPALERAAMELEQVAAEEDSAGLDSAHERVQEEISRLMSEH